MKSAKTTARIVACLLALMIPAMQAQNDEDVFELSPFEVDGSGDVGYAAQNTLAGSRMNSRLKDTPVPISVFTKEFIDDIGADMLEDVMDYSVNMTPELSDTDGSFGANQLTAFEARYRVRGLDADQARNYFTFNFDQDVFNMERIDESRGPNSILFGVGKAGGVINSSTKKARLSGDFTTLNLTVGDADRFRAHADYNKVLIEDKLALRLNTLYNENGDNDRPYLYRRDERHHLALTYKPLEDTTFNFEYEYGDVVDAPTQPFGAVDRASVWIESGRPSVGEGIGADQGVSGSHGGNNRVTYIDNNASVVDLMNQATTNSPLGLRDNLFTPSISAFNDPAKGSMLEVPLFAALPGPWHMRGTRGIDLMSATLGHKFGENTHVELAWAQYDFDRASFRVGGEIRLQGDPNATYASNDSANPYEGELFIESNLQHDFRYFNHDYIRGTISHEINTDGWMGRHRLAAMVQSRQSEFTRNSFQNAWIDPGTFGGPFNANPHNGRNRVFWRHYITDPTNIDDWRVGLEPNMDGNALSYTTDDGRQLVSGFVQNQAKNDGTGIDTQMLAMQNFFLNNKLVTTFGYREDDFFFNSPQGAGLRNPIDNQVTIVNRDNALVNEFVGQTTTYGAVYHLTDVVSVSYNKGTNNGISDFSDKDIIGAPGEAGGIGPVPEGETEDIALTFDLLEGKVFLKTAYYTTAQQNVTAFLSWRDFNVIGGINNLYDIGFDAGFIDQATYDRDRLTAGVGTLSDESEGYEITGIGNVTENWRVSVNYSYTHSVLKDTFSEFTPWWEGSTGKPFLSSFDSDYMDPEPARGPWPDGLNWGQAISAIESAAASQHALAGLLSNGQRHHKANFFTNYSFREGALKNFRVGGGARYKTGPVWNQSATSLGSQDFAGMTIFDLVAGWQKQFDNYTLDRRPTAASVEIFNGRTGCAGNARQ
ncbi:MAG: TonB-dependent receptor plug domain-containing protein [Opitutales bacterium]|jgi:iron complex outermembrane recepter protein|nr:TonB-dependent receptor plug domain-containing protein [Opitutales bacterium]